MNHSLSPISLKLLIFRILSDNISFGQEGEEIPYSFSLRQVFTEAKLTVERDPSKQFFGTSTWWTKGWCFCCGRPTRFPDGTLECPLSPVCILCYQKEYTERKVSKLVKEIIWQASMCWNDEVFEECLSFLNQRRIISHEQQNISTPPRESTQQVSRKTIASLQRT